MKAFLEPLRNLGSFTELEEAMERKPGVYAASGLTDAGKPHFIYGLDRAAGGARLIVTFSEQKARELMESCAFFCPDVLYFPAKDILFYQSDVRGTALTSQRMQVYQALIEEEQPVIVTTFDALMDRLVRPEVMESFLLHLKPGDTLDLEKIRKRLVYMGYEYNYQVEEPGQFSVRGGILDIFPLTGEMAYRIELWDDEIDSIRSFSPESQRSLDHVDRLTVYPASELVLGEKELEKGVSALTADARKLYDRYRKEMKTEEAFRVKQTAEYVREQILELSSIRQAESYLPYFYKDTVSFLEYMAYCADVQGQKFLVFVDEPARCMEKAEAVEQEFASSMQQRLEKGYVLPGQADTLIGRERTAAVIGRQRCVLLSSLEMRYDAFSPVRSFYFQMKSVNSYNGSFELLVKDLKYYKKEKYSVILLCNSRTRAKRMAEDLQAEELTAFYTEDADRVVQAGETMVLYGLQKKGFAYPDIKFVVLTETDIFGAEKRKKKRKKFREGQKISSFDELKPGDYVVHENHGLGIFKGIEKIEVNKTIRDYMKIEYDKGGTLYVPAYFWIRSRSMPVLMRKNQS